jgi:hypothetical protein
MRSLFAFDRGVYAVAVSAGSLPLDDSLSPQRSSKRGERIGDARCLSGMMARASGNTHTRKGRWERVRTPYKYVGVRNAVPTIRFLLHDAFTYSTELCIWHQLF